MCFYFSISILYSKIRPCPSYILKLSLHITHDVPQVVSFALQSTLHSAVCKYFMLFSLFSCGNKKNSVCIHNIVSHLVCISLIMTHNKIISSKTTYEVIENLPLCLKSREHTLIMIMQIFVFLYIVNLFFCKSI